VSEFVLDEVVGRKYLLGELPLDDQQRVEELAFLEPHSFELLQELENELVDDYISHDFTAGERSRFEAYFLSKPGRRGDLKIAMALQVYIDRNAQSKAQSSSQEVRFAAKSSLRQWFASNLNLPVPAWGLLSILILAAAIFFGLRFRRARNSSIPVQANRQIQKTDQPGDRKIEVAQVTPTPASDQTNRGNEVISPRSSTGVLSFLLVPGAHTRGQDSITKVRIAAGPSLLRFDLPLIEETDYQSYEVTLEQDDDGKVLRRWMGLRSQVRPSGRLVQLTFHSQTLKVHQQYRLVLVGVSSDATPHQIADYYFMAVN
jgi:hypothetical protein